MGRTMFRRERTFRFQNSSTGQRVGGAQGSSSAQVSGFSADLLSSIGASNNSSWRSAVRTEAGQLERAFYRLSGIQTPQLLVQVQASIDRARSVASRPADLAQWCSGALVEEAYAQLQTARETLSQLQGGEMHDVRPIMDQRTRNSVRQLRNGILGVSALLLLALIIAALVVSHLYLRVMGLGALAGAVCAILPLAYSVEQRGPYGTRTAQAILKVLAGAAVALLGVILLRKGLGGLAPARDGTALFYAVILGFGQQVLTGLVDKRVDQTCKSSETEGNQSSES